MDAKQTRLGILLALAAYFIWGIAPAYFKLIYYVPADEILTHRVIWSFFFMVALISVSRQWPQVKRLLKTPKKSSCWRSLRCWLAVTGCCLSGR
jgi:chloramphenicol-sensitive protein RarD